MSTQALFSKQYEVADNEAIEFYFERGWTDGLPVVPPTEERVRTFLEYAGRDPSDVIGVVSTRGRVITAEKVAINAVMAGCKPEYTPVVMAAVEAMADEAYNLHGCAATTGSSAQLLLLNGPVRQRLGFNSGHNLFGPGWRANSTVGRAIRLILMNVCGNTPGVMDKSTMGNPGKYSYCIAEDEESSPWQPLHVDRGFDRQESTVTVFAAQSPWQVGHRFTDRPEAILTSIADVMAATDVGNGEIMVVIPPEQMAHIKAAGWSKERCQQFLYDQAQRPAQELAARWRIDPEQAQPGQMVRACRDPKEIYIIPAGGTGGLWMAVLPMWAAGLISRSVARRIDMSRVP